MSICSFAIFTFFLKAQLKHGTYLNYIPVFLSCHHFCVVHIYYFHFLFTGYPIRRGSVFQNIINQELAAFKPITGISRYIIFNTYDSQFQQQRSYCQFYFHKLILFLIYFISFSFIVIFSHIKSYNLFLSNASVTKLFIQSFLFTVLL